MCVRNINRGSVLAETLLTLRSNFTRTLRHLNQNGIPSDCALWISPCQAIYTVGMRFPVDIIFIDNRGVVVKALKNFPPNCYVESSKKAVSALELPCNRIAESGTEVGDLLQLDPT